MKTYELTYVASDSLSDDQVLTLASEVTKQIESLGGVIIKEEPWGKRRLAYPINHRQFGYYITIQTHLDGPKVKELEQFLRLQTEVLRYLVVNLIPQAVKTSDEAELVEALDKRVEEKISQQTEAETGVTQTEEEVTTETPQPPELPQEPKKDEEPKEPKPKSRAKKSKDESKEVNDEERKKLVEEKLSELLGEDKE